MCSRKLFPSRRPGTRAIISFAVWLSLAALMARGQSPGLPPAPAPVQPVLTNIVQLWTIPADQRTNEFRIRTEVLIYFIDPEWGNASGECEGNPQWLPIFDSPYPLKAGERVAIDGVIVPQRERFVWSKTRVRVLQENVPSTPEAVSNLNANPAGLNGHLITVEGLIDGELDEATHTAIDFLSGNTAARVYVLKGANHSAVPFKPGDFIRITCVYSPQFGRDGSMSGLSLWVSQPSDVQVIGSLATDPRFDLPLTLSRDIQLDTPTGAVVRVEGMVRKHEPGLSVTLWDATGQITVDSKQSQPLQTGERIEAVGYPFFEGVQQSLRNGLYRTESMTNITASPLMTVPKTLPLCLAEEVRDLTPTDAGRHLPVHLHAVVTWSHTNTPFAYLQDPSGGIRVVNPRWDSPDTAKPGTIVIVDGVTSEGDFVPVITNALLHRAGWWNIEGDRLVTLEEARTGVEEGNWVEMRGLVRDVTLTNGLVCFDLATPTGEFQAWTPATDSFDWLAGAIIQVSGVCSVQANARHQLTGIRIWTPERKYIQTVEPAPQDVFALPLRPLASLRRFDMESALNQRIRTSGTVVLQVPGQFLYVQDDADSVFALSQQTNGLQPGDRVEVVGFPGHEGQKFVLREAVYRRMAGGPEPTPAILSATNPLDASLDGILTSTTGLLLNKQEKEGETRLLVRKRDFTFEATLMTTSQRGNEMGNLAPGSHVALTGVYEMQDDEYGRPHSFLLRLRSANDLQVLSYPSWWTLPRLLGVLVGVVAIFVIALIWAILIARKNAMLNHAQTELKRANDQLETRVAQRTRELEERVATEEQARHDLARAQRELMLASRQAGMAEVATGVLHNVGNVLNSINISTTLLREKAQTSEGHSLQKLADLLQERNDDLAAFLTTDPRGKLVPRFIRDVAGHLKNEQESAARELEQLSKNVDHIKDIVTMQQSYARVAGVIERTNLADLVEDAIQINQAGLARHGVKLVRRFEELPPIMVDKHKVLQILINLIRNAKYALDACAHGEKRLVITLASVDPKTVKVQVEDNGTGIPPEHMTRIFSHGFTTRASGHGFGLHLGAINASEMGGSLSAASDGAGRGATFTLILPLHPPAS